MKENEIIDLSDEVTGDLKSQLYENVKTEVGGRLKSKVIISYIISWIIFNWKSVFYILFSSDSVENKLKSEFVHVTWSWSGPSSFYIPIIGVFIYMVFFPVIEVLFRITSKWLTKQMKLKLIDLHKNERISELKAELEILEKRLQLESETFENDEIDNLKMILDSYKNEISNLENIIKSKDKTIINLTNNVNQLNSTINSSKNIQTRRRLL